MIIHIPHSSVVLPESDTYVIDPTDEINRVTDWYTDILFEHDGTDQTCFTLQSDVIGTRSSVTAGFEGIRLTFEV
jgi:hypothetical protein